MTKTKKQYWIRYCGDFKAIDTMPVSTELEALDILRDSLTAVNFTFAYIMTTDAFGECFLSIVRRSDNEFGLHKEHA